MESKRTLTADTWYRLMLLIEPVWNRNEVEVRHTTFHELSFNRTSMESKLNCSPRSRLPTL